MAEKVRQGEMKSLGRRGGGLGEITDKEFDALLEIINHADARSPIPYPSDTSTPPYKGLFEKGYITGEDKGFFKKKTVLVPTEKGRDAYKIGYTKRMEQEDVKL